MKRLHLALIISCFLISFPVAAQQAALQPRTQGGITFISGGVGTDERVALKSIWPEYNLSLLFSAKGSGEYLSEVIVHIEDSKGRTILKTKSDGPLFFVKLQPDRYKIIVDQNGKIMDKVANLAGKQQISLSFTFMEKQKN